MSALAPFPAPALAPARAAFTATANAHGALLTFIALGGDGENPLTAAHLLRAHECLVTATARMADAVAALPRNPEIHGGAK